MDNEDYAKYHKALREAFEKGAEWMTPVGKDWLSYQNDVRVAARSYYPCPVCDKG